MFAYSCTILVNFLSSFSETITIWNRLCSLSASSTFPHILGQCKMQLSLLECMDILLAIDFAGGKRNRTIKIRAQLRILKCIAIVKEATRKVLKHNYIVWLYSIVWTYLEWRIVQMSLQKSLLCLQYLRSSSKLFRSYHKYNGMNQQRSVPRR